jgi:uncharacterized protein (DUF58 family)
MERSTSRAPAARAGERAGRQAQTAVPRLARRAGLELCARRVLDGLYAGNHRTAALGTSIDFAEHRPYQPGDDLRAIDWRAYGRSDRLLLRRWHDERRLPVALIVDGSTSMDYGTPPKIERARLVAAVLGVMALDQGDEARLLEGSDARAWPPAHAGPGAAGRLAQALLDGRRTVTFDAAAALTAAATQLRRRTLVVLISDLLCAPGPLAAAAALGAQRGHEVAVLQPLDESELALEAGWGRSLLVDPEGAVPDVSCDAAEAKDAYDRAMAAHLAELHRRLAAARADHLLLRGGADPIPLLAGWLLRRRRQR